MADLNYVPNESFDFSLEAGEFKKSLWHRLQEIMDASILELDDDDLLDLHAAGTPFSMKLPDDES